MRDQSTLQFNWQLFFLRKAGFRDNRTPLTIKQISRIPFVQIPPLTTDLIIFDTFITDLLARAIRKSAFYFFPIARFFCRIAKPVITQSETVIWITTENSHVKVLIFDYENWIWNYFEYFSASLGSVRQYSRRWSK